MILNRDKLIGLAVKTENGQMVGKVIDFKLNGDNSKIEKYIVSPSKLVEKITSKNLIIDTSQVVRITTDEMIINDSSIKEKGTVGQLVSA